MSQIETKFEIGGMLPIAEIREAAQFIRHIAHKRGLDMGRVFWDSQPDEVLGDENYASFSVYSYEAQDHPGYIERLRQARAAGQFPPVLSILYQCEPK